VDTVLRQGIQAERGVDDVPMSADVVSKLVAACSEVVKQSE
jgi:hypothetical protein